MYTRFSSIISSGIFETDNAARTIPELMTYESPVTCLTQYLQRHFLSPPQYEYEMHQEAVGIRWQCRVTFSIFRTGTSCTCRNSVAVFRQRKRPKQTLLLRPCPSLKQQGSLASQSKPCAFSATIPELYKLNLDEQIAKVVKELSPTASQKEACSEALEVLRNVAKECNLKTRNIWFVRLAYCRLQK